MAISLSRVFRNGNSQAVRIPQEFRLDATQVEIRRNELGELVLRPLPADRGGALLDALRAFDDELTADFVARVSADRREQAPVQERDAL
jgi:antitoxin VapB